MYKLKLVYLNQPLSQTAKEFQTADAVVHLLNLYGIDCCQLTASTLAFDCERDRLLASLALSGSETFRTVYLDV